MEDGDLPASHTIIALLRAHNSGSGRPLAPSALLALQLWSNRTGQNLLLPPLEFGNDACCRMFACPFRCTSLHRCHWVCSVCHHAAKRPLLDISLPHEAALSRSLSLKFISLRCYWSVGAAILSKSSDKAQGFCQDKAPCDIADQDQYPGSWSLPHLGPPAELSRGTFCIRLACIACFLKRIMNVTANASPSPSGSR